MHTNKFRKIMLKKLLIFSFSFYALTFGQFHQGSRQIALGNAFTPISDDHWSMFFNPAGLSYVKSVSAGFFYSPAPFGIKELSNGSVSIANTFSSFSGGFSIYTYGFELYRENSFALGIAKKFFNELRIGIRTKLNTLVIKNYGNDYYLGFDLGFLTSLSENLNLGFAIVNLNRPTYGVNKEKVPQIFMGGFAYKPLQNFLLALELEKDFKYPFNFKFGSEYNLLNLLMLRFGYNTEPVKYFSGIGINYKNFSFNYAFHSHNVLGYTHSFGIDLKLSEQ